MRIVFAVRRYSPEWGQTSRYVAHASRQLTMDGHQISIIAENVSPFVGDATGATIVRTLTAATDADYHTESHSYSDRVYETLRQLGDVDAVEFDDAGAEGFTAIRAKRMLREFAGTTLAVRVHHPAPAWDRTVHFEKSVRLFAEDYCRRHADLLLAPTARKASGRTAVHSPYPLVTVEAVDSGLRPPRIVYSGPLDPSGGVDVFVAAANRLAVLRSDLTFVLFGPHTDYRSFGRPYADDLNRLISGPLRDRLTIAHPAGEPERIALWRGARYAVFPAHTENQPYEALDAMSSGCVVICGEHGGLAEWIRHGETGLVTDLRHPSSLVDLLMVEPAEWDKISRRGAQAVREVCDPAAATTHLCTAYERARHRPGPSRRPGRPPVSVIVSAHRKGPYLAETIASVRASTYPDVEIVTVNDGCVDPRTLAAFDALRGVTKVSKPNGGPASAYNAGLAAATGEFILPLDGDDRVHPRYLELAVDAFQRNDDLAYVHCYTRYFGMFDLRYAPVGYVPDLMLFLNTEGKRSKVFRRSVLEAVGGYDENLPTLDDWEIQIRLAERGYHGDLIPRELFLYRRHLDSLTFRSPDDMFLDEARYILTKHADLAARQASTALPHLLHLWKNRVELSRSAQWRASRALKPAT